MSTQTSEKVSIECTMESQPQIDVRLSQTLQDDSEYHQLGNGDQQRPCCSKDINDFKCINYFKTMEQTLVPNKKCGIYLLSILFKIDN